MAHPHLHACVSTHDCTCVHTYTHRLIFEKTMTLEKEQGKIKSKQKQKTKVKNRVYKMSRLQMGDSGVSPWPSKDNSIETESTEWQNKWRSRIIYFHYWWVLCLWILTSITIYLWPPKSVLVLWAWAGKQLCRASNCEVLVSSWGQPRQHSPSLFHLSDYKQMGLFQRHYICLILVLFVDDLTVWNCWQCDDHQKAVWGS